MSDRVRWRLTWLALLSWGVAGPVDARDINVSLTGDDAGPGTRQQPYRTLRRAQSEARTSRREQPGEPVTVWINPGDWPLDGPLEFTPEDSGTPEARVLYRAVPRAIVRLIGSRGNADPAQPDLPDAAAAPLVQLTDVSCLMLRGLMIEGGAGHGVVVRGGAENVVAGCRIRNVVGYGVVLEGGREHAVLSCDVEQAGGGVWLSGGDETVSPRSSAGHRVMNNHIWRLIARAGVNGAGINCGIPWLGQGERRPVVGVHAAYNLVHDVPRDGVLLGGWDGVFECNEIFRFGGSRPGDGAAFVCRDSGGASGGMILRHNLVHHGRDGCGFDLDALCEVHVSGNVVSGLIGGTGFRFRSDERSSASPRSVCSNNVVVACETGLEFADILLASTTHNVTVRCARPRSRPETETSVKEPLAFGKNLSYDDNPGFADLDRLDFRLPSDSPVFQRLPGFVSIPVERIGLSLDKYRTELPSEENLHRLTKP